MTNFTENSLWLTFKLDGADYCVLSDYVESVQIPGKIESIPCSAETVAGVTTCGESILTVIEMRTVFGRMNLSKYTEQFGVMKDMHVTWVEDLERFVHQGGEFNKPVDPHKCKFGLWYDNFHTENFSLNYILKKLSAPHERIHNCGAEIKKLLAKGSEYLAEAEVKLEEAKTICDKEIVPLLDRLIEAYKEANRGILVVVNDGVNKAALLVDEVTTLIPCHKTTQHGFPVYKEGNSYLREIVVDGNAVMLEINVEAIIGTEQPTIVSNDAMVMDTATATTMDTATATTMDTATDAVPMEVQTEMLYLVTANNLEVREHSKHTHTCPCCNHHIEEDLELSA